MPIPSIRYSQLKHLHFVDFDNHEMGTLEDLVLEESTFSPSFLILGSSFFEEFMEEIGERDNIDEIAPIECIDRIEGDYVILSCRLDDLDTTNKKGETGKRGYLLSELMQYTVKLDNEEDIGQFYDYLIDEKSCRFIISLTTITERLYQKGYGQKFNLMVSPQYLKINEEKIEMTISSDDIEQRIIDTIEMRQRGRDLIDWG